MLLNKEKRVRYLGFNDVWFMIVGILILSFITDYLFTNSFGSLPFIYAVLNWSVSLIFATTNWIVMRSFLIGLRKRFPSFNDDIKRTVLFFLSIVATVVTVDFLGDLILSNIFGENYNHPNRSKIILPIILISTMTMAIYEAIYYYVRLKKSIREEERAKQAIVQGQLDTLRNQAKPHFLFNSLNTLRDIIDQNSKDDAKQFVDKIADVYRFILDAGNDNLIALRDELKFARAYVHIQKERFGDNLKIHWDLPDTALDHLLVPMSLQQLLENAIKHNVVSKANPLQIQVKVGEGYLMVSNPMQPKSTQLPSTEVGLKNIKKRYSLISGKEPLVENNGKRFMVSLPLLQASDQKQAYERTDH